MIASSFVAFLGYAFYGHSETTRRDSLGTRAFGVDGILQILVS